jgi:hypothetical protein
VGSVMAQLSTVRFRSIQFTSARWGKKRGKDFEMLQVAQMATIQAKVWIRGRD